MHVPTSRTSPSAALALILLLGCGGEEASQPRGPAMHALTLEGFRVEAPARFHDLEPERIAGLEAAPSRTDPGATSRVRAVRGESMSEGTVMLIRVEHPQPELEGDTVEAALRQAVELDTGSANRPGATIESLALTPHAGVLETTLHVVVTDGDAEIAMRTRSVYWLEPDGDLRVVGVQCMAPPRTSRRMCPEVLRSFEWPDTLEGRALDTPL